MFLCNVSGFRYSAILLLTNIDRDYGGFLDFWPIVPERFAPIMFGLDFFYFVKNIERKK